jgi:hypothetical protein
MRCLIEELLEMPSDPNARKRAGIAFFFLFVSIAALSVGAYYLANFGKLQEQAAAREDQAVLRGITDARQLEEALGQHPSNRFLQMMATAARVANETRATAETLFNEVEPPALSKGINFGTASRADLEAMRSDLKTAEANARAFMPHYSALLKAERDKVETYARSLRLEKDFVSSVLDGVDKRHVKTTAFTSMMLSARADYYRAYENYVALLVGEFGSYKVVNGQFIFPLQRTVDRYNVAAHAMAIAAKRVNELEDEKKQTPPQQVGWEQFVDGK